ncbi:hypothetical protein [Nostoc sp.]|uniref:hypothetical protein n=1 Tax=Nostoc sp. TaxID=1180 RepID=UPI002FF6F4C5
MSREKYRQGNEPPFLLYERLRQRNATRSHSIWLEKNAKDAKGRNKKETYYFNK